MIQNRQHLSRLVGINIEVLSDRLVGDVLSCRDLIEQRQEVTLRNAVHLNRGERCKCVLIRRTTLAVLILLSRCIVHLAEVNGSDAAIVRLIVIVVEPVIIVLLDLNVLIVLISVLSHTAVNLVKSSVGFTELISCVGNATDCTESDNTLDDLLYVHNSNLQI